MHPVHVDSDVVLDDGAVVVLGPVEGASVLAAAEELLALPIEHSLAAASLPPHEAPLHALPVRTHSEGGTDEPLGFACR